MKVILLEKVEKLGNTGDIVEVKGGFARNFLIPNEKALRATNQNIKFFEEQKDKIDQDNQAKKTDAENISEKLKDVFVTILVQAGEDGRLFGSITSKAIAEEVSKTVQIDKKNIILTDSIKYVGVYQVNVQLHSEVKVKININVARSADEAEANKNEFLNPKEETAEAI